ncbi:MAG: adenylyl-sulfate kinase [Ignavibacteriae bacterium]|nr:adenylyl-sulfate kinase [Ignavibacteriota bacterium]
MENQKSFVIWFTGLSASGKTTVSEHLKKELLKSGVSTVLFDGDTMRKGISKDLGFSDDDRKENIRRTAEMAKLVTLSGVSAICALISPFVQDRQAAKGILSDFHFVEVYVSTPFEICEKRDPKGFYKKARIKEIIDFTGIDSIYEKPVEPDIAINTESMSPDECVKVIIDYLKTNKII